MPDDPNAPLYRDPAYMYGQVLALRVLMLALARTSIEPTAWRDLALPALERLRTAALPEPQLSDTFLIAIDQTEDWVKTMVT